MSRGAVYRHVSLWRENREAVELPFLEIDQELWNRAGTRLTLLFDPGRIKRGLVPNREAGPPLEPGVHYRLQIATGWPDARGAPLVQIYCKDFVVVAADRDPPDPARWKIHAPRAGTRDPLSVEFPEPMDRALLDTMLFVEKTEGDITVDRDETRWQFTPREPWSAGEHGLNFDTALEDLAGNRIGRLFDVDVFERVDRRIRREIRSLRFRIE
jgi:hypothetical protein